MLISLEEKSNKIFSGGGGGSMLKDGIVGRHEGNQWTVGGGDVVDRDVVPDEVKCGGWAVPSVVLCAGGVDPGDTVESVADDSPSKMEVCGGVVGLNVVFGVVDSPAVVRVRVVDFGVVACTGGRHLQFT